MEKLSGWISNPVPRRSRATQGSPGQTKRREEAIVVSAAGINCKLNVRVCTNAAQPNRGCAGAMSPRAGHLLVAWGSLACPHCSAAWPVHPRGMVRGRADATPLVSFPPHWVFLIPRFQGSGPQTCAGPHLGNTVAGYTPKQQAVGLHQGCRVWGWVRDGGLRREWFEKC